jgi:hypothetical protein
LKDNLSSLIISLAKVEKWLSGLGERIIIEKHRH